MIGDDIVLRGRPTRLRISDYDLCRRRALEYLERIFPESAVFEVGSTDVLPGFSDLDFLIVNDSVDGNRLYLRRLNWSYVNRKRILRHECFAIDSNTYMWLDRLTSYRLQSANEKANSLERKTLRLPRRSIDYFFLLSLYSVCNYPMQFCSISRTNIIDIVHDYSKLRKLLKLEELASPVFGLTFIPSSFTDRLCSFASRFWTLSDRRIAREMYDLLLIGRNIVYQFFCLLDDFACRTCGRSPSEDGFLRIGTDTLRFSDDWKDTFRNADGSFNLPRGLVYFTQVFRQIEGRFLAGIEYEENSGVVSDLQAISEVINSYLGYCEESSMGQMIFDIGFSIRGHDSLLFRSLSVPRRIRTMIFRNKESC